MNIEDIAKLANVSISTVSKIVNGKDAAISAKTRERVLSIVKEYNYTPYSSVVYNSSRRRFLIGFLTGLATSASHEMLQGSVQRAQESNYSVISSDSDGDIERETKNITMLCRAGIDGVIWDSVGNESRGDLFEQINIEMLQLNKDSDNAAIFIDYRKIGYQAARSLIDSGHSRIGCICYPNKSETPLFLSGFKQCMIDHKIMVDEATYVISFDNLDRKIFERRFTGFVCFDEKITAKLKLLAANQNIRVPHDISILGLCTQAENPFAGEVSVMILPMRKYGYAVCDYLIARIEKQDDCVFEYDWNLTPDTQVSLDVPYDSRHKEILVIGSINVDFLLNIDSFPQVGKTVLAYAVNTIPGGKGLNQAVGAAKLSGNVSLIARVGSDYEGTGIYDVLRENKINTAGITTDEHLSTGKAYIYVQSDGDSSIIIYPGANKNLCIKDIEKNEKLFKRAGYCLLPMEVPIETALFALERAKHYGVRTILKPSTLGGITDELLRMTDFFIPNEKETDTLCPDIEKIEDKAAYFLEKGAGAVIITLGGRGCYVKSAEFERFYSAEPVKVLDTTGGADAFICSLAVYLNEQHPLDEAVRYATGAAGFCVSRQGALPALADRTTLDLYMSHKRKQ